MAREKELFWSSKSKLEAKEGELIDPKALSAYEVFALSLIIYWQIFSLLGGGLSVLGL